MFPQQGLDHAPHAAAPFPGIHTGIGHVLKAYPRDWLVTLRDVTVSEMQPRKCKVIGPLMPPEHRPQADPPVRSFCAYGFFGGRRDDAWAIPVHNGGMTSDEREDNAYFLRLLDIKVRIGKLPGTDGDTVFEIVAGDGRFLINLNTGNLIMEGADGSAKIEIEGGGKIHISAKAGSLVECDDGTGAVTLLKLTEHNTHVSTKYSPHKHPVPMVGSSGPPDLPGATATGTEVLKGK